MLKRFGKLIKNESRHLIKKFERPIDVLEDAKMDMFNKAVECEKKSIEIQNKVENLKEGKTKEKLISLSKTLHEKVKTYKKKYEECDSKSQELLGRKLAAETTLDVMKDTRGLLKDTPLAVLKELEDDIINIESEVDALINVENFK